MYTRRPKARLNREVWMRVIDPAGMKRARKRAGYTQYDLAALARCTQAAISALETGAMRGCSEDLALSICKWVDRDLEDLFQRHETVRSPGVATGKSSSRQTVAA